MAKVQITDTILRDGHQSQAATRMRTDEMLPACEMLDKVGYYSLECWGGATYDACLRFLNEDPWERLRKLRKALPNTKLQMLLRGQNLLGYRPYADDVVDFFVKKAVENGIDIIRIFDALNDVRNLEQAIKSTKKYGGQVEATLSYTISPIHNEDYFVKLGRELEYFTTVDCIGQGLPVLLPKGARVVQVLQRWVEDVEQKRGYLLTKTPLMAKRDLYKISGHWDHYLDGMFILGDPYDETKECFALRPMTCPFQYQVYLNRQRSYRDLPMRLGETSTLFRNEDSGEMHGLIRVRQFTISEGHLVLRPDQLEEEFKGCLDLAKYCLGTVGLLDKCTFRFSQWDPANPNNKYEGTAEQWEHAQSVMERILKDLDVNYTVGIDEAAFYGPKLDIQYKNVYGKEDTLVTIQIDMLLAERFGMYYIDENGEKKLPYIIHRTSLGCYERTLAYLIEEYAGALPTWMAPEQVRFLPVTDRAADYCAEQARTLENAGFRVEVDYRNEKIGRKIRDAQMEKVPYMVVVGDRDMENGTVSPRHRADGDLGAMSMDAFAALLKQVVDNKEKK